MSPKVKYDVSNVDEAGGFEHVQPGMYVGKIAEINLKESKSGNGPMLEVILQPVKTADGKPVKPKDKKKQIARVYTYVLLEHEPSDWKLKEFIKAVGLKDKGMIDTDKLTGKSIQMNLKPDTDLDDHYRPRVGKLIALPSGAKANGASSRAAEPDEDDDEGDDGDGEAYTIDDLEQMEDDELLAIADEFEAKKPSGRMTPVKRKKLVKDILAAQEEAQDEDEDEDDTEVEDEDNDDATEDTGDDEDEDDEDEDEDEDEEEDEEEDDDEEDEEDDEEESGLEETLAELDRAGLKSYIKEHELDISVKKSMEDEDIREAIMDAVGDEEDEDETVDYTSWSIDALKKEAQERGLSTKGSKKILAGRLDKDDADEDNPF